MSSSTEEAGALPFAALLAGTLLSLASLAFIRYAPDVLASRDGVVHVIYNFRETKWLALAIAGIVWAVLLALGLIRRVDRVGLSALDGVVGVLILLSVASLLWTPDLAAGLLELLHLAVLATFFLLARLTARDGFLSLALAFALAGLAIFLLVPLLGDTQNIDNGFGNENFASEFALMAAGFALIGTATRGRVLKRIAVAASIVGLVYLLAFAPSNLQFLGVAMAAFYFGLTYLPFAWRWRIAAAAAVAGVLVLVVGLSFLPLGGVPITIMDRLQGWANTVLLLRDHPILGVGIGGYYHQIAGYVDAYRAVFPGLGAPAYQNFERLAPSAENDALHVAATLGIVGVATTLLLLVLAVRRSLSAERGTYRWCWVTLFALFGASLVSFPLQNPATGVGFAVLLGVVGHEGRVTVGISKVGRVAALGSAIAFALLCIPLLAETRAHAALSLTNALQSAGRLQEAAEQIQQAAEISDLSPRIRLQMFPQTMIAGPDYWRDHLEPGEIERIYRTSATAAPEAPLLLDLRARYLLSRPKVEYDREVLVAMIGRLKELTGHASASPHILEAALALQESDLDAASRALDVAEPLLLTDETGNMANFRALRQAIARARAQ